MATAYWTTTAVAAFGAALMAGTYFAFSAFVMTSLSQLPANVGMSAMQSINRVIVGSGFGPVFFGSTAMSLILVVWSIARWSQPGSQVVLVAGVLYVLGMFLLTATQNVPLNDALEATSAATPEGVAFWERYVSRWTWWNHVRTVASAASASLYVFALVR